MALRRALRCQCWWARAGRVGRGCSQIQYAAPVSQPTQGDRVAVALRDDILGGRLRPGQKLPFAELRDRYATSVGVLRESLSRLVSEGLVVNEPQVGFRVLPLSAEDLRQLTEARLFVEGQALQLAVRAGDVEWESRLVGAHHALERTPELTDSDPPTMNDEWSAAHGRFHNLLLQACPNRRLLAVAETLRASAELYRRWSAPLGAGTRDVRAEHRRLLDAALAGDADGALAALADHLAHTRRLLDEANVRPPSR